MELKEKAFQMLGFTDQARHFVEEIWRNYPRHRQDQFRLIIRSLKEYPQSAKAALERCIHEDAYSANSFKHFLAYEDAWRKRHEPIKLLESQDSPQQVLESAPQRSVDSYLVKLGVG
jgi:hypothetical protein